MIYSPVINVEQALQVAGENVKYSSAYTSKLGTAVAQWLWCCTTNQKAAGSIPDGVMEFFIDINPSDRTMALESTQPLTEMRTRNISCW